MHSYAIDSDIRKTVILVIFIVCLILNGLINQPLEILSTIISTSAPLLSEMIESLNSIGISLNSISTLAFFGILYFLFSKFLWKNRLLQRILDIPDLNGCWGGGLVSSYEDENGKAIEVMVQWTIKQTWDKIFIASQFSRSVSFSDSVCIQCNSNKGVLLLFSYTNENQNVTQAAKGLREHRGFKRKIETNLDRKKRRSVKRRFTIYTAFEHPHSKADKLQRKDRGTSAPAKK